MPAERSALIRRLVTGVLAPSFAAAPPLLKEAAITIKPAADKRDKRDKKDKGPSKEEACRLALEAVACVAREYEADAEADLDADSEAERVPAAEPLRRLMELQPPDKVPFILCVFFLYCTQVRTEA